MIWSRAAELAIVTVLTTCALRYDLHLLVLAVLLLVWWGRHEWLVRRALTRAAIVPAGSDNHPPGPRRP